MDGLTPDLMPVYVSCVFECFLLQETIYCNAMSKLVSLIRIIALLRKKSVNDEVGTDYHSEPRRILIRTFW